MKIKWFGKFVPEPNGCGPEGLQWAIPNFIFKPACDVHDILTATKPGYWKTQTYFYQKMRFLIKLRKKSWWYEIPAFIYFLAVVLFNWIWYYNVWEKTIAFINEIKNLI